ncbi:hypothetical protein THRCLA_22201 [Thraustotheca clavata]|uniref:B30.2/SPRY domain-containing protein n=1 Tax=Thraustotheca clavata TaxID=74557 RepID=A0A1V9ZAB3_9STRA|nr:hypothetical protein THRCLA_22201 [Thraustotheca clavata]
MEEGSYCQPSVDASENIKIEEDVQALQDLKKEIEEGQRVIRVHQRQLVEMQELQVQQFKALEDNLVQMQQLFQQQIKTLNQQYERLEAQNEHLDAVLAAKYNLSTPKGTKSTMSLFKSPRKRVLPTRSTRTKQIKQEILSDDDEKSVPTLWDASRAGQFTSITDNGRTVLTNGYGWNVVIAEDMIETFDVHLHFPKSKYTNTIAIGFTCEPEFYHEPTPDMQVFDFWKSGYYINVRRGTLCSRDGHDNASFGPAFKSGDILTVVFDRTMKTIRFLRNGNHLGIAYSDIHESQLYPALVSYDRGVKIKLMPI